MPQRNEIAAIACAAFLLCAGCVQSLPPQTYAQPAAPLQQAYAPQPPPPPPAPAEAPPVQAPSNADLDALVAPIALYPDPLLAILLPAATNPSDIVAAAGYLEQYGDRTQIDYQPWDPSVRALAHYPGVVKWMAQNMDWAGALGSAFASSPAQVMEAVQRMRERALAAGTLVSTAQQAIYSDDGYIEIYPTDPGYLYVPAYDPGVVYADEPYGGAGPYVDFGAPYPEGEWLSFYFDWGSHHVWHGGQSVWAPRTGWRPPPGGRPIGGSQPWHARPNISAGPARPGAIPAPKPLRAPPPAPPAESRSQARPILRETQARPTAPSVPLAPGARPPAPRAPPAPRSALPHAPRAESPPRSEPAHSESQSAPPSRKPENER